MRFFVNLLFQMMVTLPVFMEQTTAEATAAGECFQPNQCESHAKASGKAAHDHPLAWVASVCVFIRLRKICERVCVPASQHT